MGQIKIDYFNKHSRDYILLLVIFVLFNLHVSPCQCGLIDVSSSDDDSKFLDSWISGSYDSSAKYIYISKTLIHNRDSHSPNENLSIFVEIRFISGDKWDLNDLIIKEFIDKNLNANDKSLRWTIINDVNNLNKYKNDLNALKLNDSKASWGKNNSNFTIIVPNKFDSSCRLVFWYNVTIKKTGTFDVKTILISNPDAKIPYDVEKSFKIYATSYDIIAPYFQTLKEIILLLVVLSGIFTIYKEIIRNDRVKDDPEIIRNDREKGDPDSYHLPEFIKEMINEIEILIKAIPTYLVVILFLALEAILIYIYISSLYPSLYPSISEYIERNWTLIRGVSPIIVTLLITLTLLYIKKGPKGLLHDICVYLEKISPMEAIILILNYHLFIFALFIIIKQFR
ncbi:MAG: hypothetical protein PHS80_12575 [Methanothrix sp.]|nr:hypothetical protein [Methanothrix sp.]MDD4448188.1 hypothetical protein [Methanothrix sp.]